MTSIAYLFSELTPPKNVVRSMFKKFCFTEPFDKKRGKFAETL